MFFKKIVFSVCFFSLFVINARPELYIVKKVNGEKVPLDESDWKNYKKKKGIYSILQKYQWPMSTVSKIKTKERSKLYSENPNAELKFIEKKIQKKFPNNLYKVMFIPSVVYELFAMLMMLSNKNDAWETISNTLFSNNEFKDFLTKNKKYKFEEKKVNELLYLAFMIGENFGGFPGFGELILDNNINAAMKNKDQKTHNEIVAGIYTLYTNVNSHEVSKKVHFLLNWYISNQMINTYGGKSFHEIAGAVITQIDTLLFKGETKKINRINIQSVAEIIKIRIENNSNPCLDLSLLKNEIFESGVLKADGIIARTITLEEEANKKNQALLFRGTGVFQKIGGIVTNKPKKLIETKKTMHIASSLRIIPDKKEPGSFDEIVTAYKKGFFNPFSIAFGQSLFAGFFSDRGATVYNYIQNKENYGYALTIDKINYYVANLLHIKDLFFIPPLSTLSSLFACYEFFHPRGKACIPGNPLKYNGKFYGFSWNVSFPDHSGLFLIQRDPLKHERLFSKFVADNAVIIKSGSVETLLPVEQKAFKKAQAESAGFYGAIATMKQLSEKAKEHLDLLTNLSDLKDLPYETYGSVKTKTLAKTYQKNEELLGFYNIRAFEADASYNDLDMDKNAPVRTKLCKIIPPLK